jgi:NhaA family Na+:H+ antiporter
MSKFLSGINRPISHEAISGCLLGFATLGALLIRNSSWGALYIQSLNTPLFSFNWLGITHSMHAMHIINEGLMVCFFALVSIEIKREFLIGAFRDIRYALLPCAGALGGILIPAALYLLLNWHNPMLRSGWAIPTATDIAFSLGVLSLLGQQVPIALKIFLTTLAIFDDLCAVFIIALAYSGSLQWAWLGVGVLVSGLLYTLNKYRIQLLFPYFLLGLLLWWAVLHSGIHATLAGVLWAAFIPLHSPSTDKRPALLYRLEAYLRPVVDYLILPAFAFTNAGVLLSGIHWDSISHPLCFGVFVGLVLGKPLGIILGSGLVLATGITPLPLGMHWRHLVSVACLGGIGFTMSLLISSLAFSEESLLMLARQAILGGSLCSAIIALFVFPKAGARLFPNSR